MAPARTLITTWLFTALSEELRNSHGEYFWIEFLRSTLKETVAPIFPRSPKRDPKNCADHCERQTTNDVTSSAQSRILLTSAPVLFPTLVRNPIHRARSASGFCQLREFRYPTKCMPRSARLSLLDLLRGEVGPDS